MRGFKPKLWSALKGYTGAHAAADIGAGLTVGVVALPLAMAFAIASGLKPEAGLFTAVVAGFLISFFGGSRVQIGGPAGAFIVVVYSIVAKHGVSGLALATAMSGAMLFAMGALGLGALVRFIPVAVVIGFTNGIAILIGLSQIRDAAGLEVSKMPADAYGVALALWMARTTFNGQSALLCAACLAILALWSYALPKCTSAGRLGRWAARVPGTIVALVAAALAAKYLGLRVETIGSRVGELPSVAPSFRWIEFSWEMAKSVAVPAATLAMLGAIESLLCARVADGMSKDRHDSNQELMAQGIANCAAPFFGGMPATGTIARTVANIKSGAKTPVAGMVHSVAVMLAMVAAAPLASGIPMPALAAILLFVSWNMGEWREFGRLSRYRPPYRATLLGVFALTVVVDLSAAVEAGMFAAGLVFIYRISSLSGVDEVGELEEPALAGLGGMVVAARAHGALFFGAVEGVERLGRALPSHKIALDMQRVIYLDSSGAEALRALAVDCAQAGVALALAGLSGQPRDMCSRVGILAMLGAGHDCLTLAEAIGDGQSGPVA